VDSRWCDNSGTRLHYLDRAGGDALPVLAIPGWAEAAAEYAWLADRLPERRVVVADLRGRGESDAPERGYTFEHHVRDVAAIVAASALRPMVLVAFSRGSSYALGYARDHRADVRGLVMGDYEARHVRLPPQFVEIQSEMRVRGVVAAERIARHVAEQVQVDSREVPMWDDLATFDFPVLLMRGGRRGSLVGDDSEARYRAALPSLRVATITGAGHDLWSRDVDAYLAVLRPFLAECDAAARERERA
jgi:pimeloyl-ACP methyl ester carboxylesterase